MAIAHRRRVSFDPDSTCEASIKIKVHPEWVLHSFQGVAKSFLRRPLERRSSRGAAFRAPDACQLGDMGRLIEKGWYDDAAGLRSLFLALIHKDLQDQRNRRESDKHRNAMKGHLGTKAGVFRVVPGFVAQFGLPAKPQPKLENIKDDPVKANGSPLSSISCVTCMIMHVKGV